MVFISTDSSNIKDDSHKGKNRDLRNVVVNVWGTGDPLREFMHSHDMAEACVFIMENADINDIIGLNQIQK